MGSWDKGSAGGSGTGRSGNFVTTAWWSRRSFLKMERERHFAIKRLNKIKMTYLWEFSGPLYVNENCDAEEPMQHFSNSCPWYPFFHGGS